MVQIKEIQALVWWIYGLRKHGIALEASIFTPDVLHKDKKSKRIQIEQESTNMIVKAIYIFYLDIFDTQKDKLLNMLFQKFGLKSAAL